MIRHSIYTFLLAVLWCLFSAAQEPAPRWLQIPSIPNARDAGGYATGNGNLIKPGILFRSNAPAWLGEDECVRLRMLGIKAVIDLRWEAQRINAPDSPCLLSFVNYITAGIWCDEDFTVGYSTEELYLLAISKYALSFQTLFQSLAEPANYPVLIHCAAGKDRTGIAVALIHLVAGVPEENAIKEFLLSNEVGYGVSLPWLQVVLNVIHAEGGIENFLSNRQISLDVQKSVQQNLLSKPAAVKEWSLF